MKSESDFERDVREWLDKIQRKFKGNYQNGQYRTGGGVGGGKGGGTAPFVFFGGLIVLAIGLFSSFYTVQPKEEAVVLRLGKYLETTSPGLHFKLPFGIDQVRKLPTRLVLQEEFGFRTRGGEGRHSTYSKDGYKKEAQMLTGDLNVADVEWVVQYRISDPKKYMFRVKSPTRNVRDVSESIMRRVVGDQLVGEVLTTGRVEIASTAKVLMQSVLDQYDFGINIVSVKLQTVNPPELVKPSFNEVNSAKQEQEKLINQAEKEYNRVIPEARGKAEQAVAEAEGFSEALVNRSKGDAEKFNRMLAEYQKAPTLTRKRIYLETMEELLKRFEKVTIVDDDLKGILPIYGNPTARVPSAQNAKGVE